MKRVAVPLRETEAVKVCSDLLPSFLIIVLTLFYGSDNDYLLRQCKSIKVVLFIVECCLTSDFFLLQAALETQKVFLEYFHLSPLKVCY